MQLLKYPSKNPIFKIFSSGKVISLSLDPGQLIEGLKMTSEGITIGTHRHCESIHCRRHDGNIKCDIISRLKKSGIGTMCFIFLSEKLYNSGKTLDSIGLHLNFSSAAV